MEEYAAIFIIFLVFSAGIKAYVNLKTEGTTIPTLSPFKWLVLREKDSSYIVERYSVFNGVTDMKVFDRYTNITPAEAERFTTLPEVKRLRYYSYIVTVEQNGTEVLFSDPLREQGIIWYPPYYTNFSV